MLGKKQGRCKGAEGEKNMGYRVEIRRGPVPEAVRRRRRTGRRTDVGQGRGRHETRRGSEDTFRDLAEKSLAGIYIIQDGVFKYSNPAFSEIFDYNVEEMIEKMGPKDMVLPEDWPTVDENIRKRVSGEVDSIHYEFKGITRTRKVIDVEVYGSRTRYQGRPAVIGTMLDITKRKRAEELLKEAEENYRSIFENAVEGIFQITPQGQFIVTNPALEKMLGYGSTEELTATLKDARHQLYVQPARRLEFMRILEKKGVAYGFECDLYKKDRSTTRVSMNARAVRDTDGSMLYYEGTVVDTTEQKKAEDELRRLNEFNTAIIDNAPIAIFTLDRRGVFNSVNPALAELSGLGPEAGERLIGLNWLKNAYTVKCGLASHISKGLRGQAFQLWDFPFINYMGNRSLYMDFKGVPLKGKNRKIEGLLCIIEETTDRVKTRAKLMQEGKMSAIGRLAAGIAHELNNPLGTLVAYSERANNYLESFPKSTVGRTDLKKLRGYLEIIEEEAFRCKSVTTDILGLSRKEGLEISEIDLGNLLDNILELMNIDGSNVRVIKTATPELPHILGDINATRHIFVNLISNAVDALDGRMDATIRIRTRVKEHQVVVEIEDNGTGIPDSIADKIFEPFFTTKESKKGIGLGLSLCYDFVSAMGGTIRVESRPGLGTTFFTALPVKGQSNTRKGRL